MAHVLKTSLISKVTNFSELSFDELFAVGNMLPFVELVINWKVTDKPSKLFY